MSTAVENAVRFNSVPYDFATAVDAGRSEGVNGALKTIEDVFAAS
jgi:hypothetical protein